MIRTASVLAAIPFMLAASPRNASAKCASPSAVVATPSGALSTPTSWVFVSNRGGGIPEIEARAGADTDANIVASIERVSRNDAFASYQVTVSLPKSLTRYRLFVDGAHVASYTVNGGQRGGPVELADPAHESTRWTCSHTETVTLRPSITAPAYRIEWATSETDYREGKRERLVVPATMLAFWGAKETTPRITLGYMNCFGETIPEAALAQGVYVGVVALVGGDEAAPADPTYVKVGDELIVELQEPAEPVYICGYAAQHQAQMRQEAETAAKAAVVADAAAKASPPRALAIVGVLIGLLLGVGLGRRVSDRGLRRLDGVSMPQLVLVTCAIAATISQTSLLAAPAAVGVGFLAFATGAAASVLAVLAQRSR